MTMMMMIIFLLIIILIDLCSSAEHRLIQLIEKLPVQTEVINLRELFLTNETVDGDFFLAKKDEYPYWFFLINHSSRGVLTIQKEIDRDQLCRLRRCRCDTHCDLELEIFVHTNEFNVELLIIRMIDQNDHRPRFSNLNQRVQLNIVENAPIGAKIKLEPAIDDDQGENGLMGYSLISSRPLPFSLRYDLTRADLALIVDETLDRETISSYQFDILAFDGDNQTGLVHVDVLIGDVNDCPPKFHQSIYRLDNISEHTPIDSVLIRLHADDDDIGVNAQITYHLLTDEPCFLLDENTGDLRLQCILDYEVKNHYQLTIEAKDHGEGSKSDHCTLIIDLIDENDHSPLIDFYPNDLPMENETLIVSLSESIPLHSLILSFSIIDRDAGENARLTWKLHRTSSSLPFELVRMTENTGELRTKALLDRESQSDFQFVLEAYDHGRPRSRSTRLPIRIVLIDENDHPPRFSSSSLHATISEHVIFNDIQGYEIYRLHADDLDQGINAKILYSIVESDIEHLFQIDPQTGIIRAMKSFDRQERSIYSFHVEARDQGHPSLSTQTQLTFTIIPRNEFSPRCQKNVSWTIDENTPEGTIIGILLCSDDDRDDPNRKMNVHARWSTDSNRTNFTVPFQILTRKYNESQNTIEILIVVNGSLDRETISHYSSIFTVTDLGNPPLITDVPITIDLLDVNDNCPELHLENSFLMINRDLFVDHYHLQLIGTDADLNDNGKITFQLSTSLPFIQLYPNGTLIIETKSKIMRDDSYFIIHIQMRDHGRPTPCFTAETLRFYLGSNRTDWLDVLHRFQSSNDPNSKNRISSNGFTDKHFNNSSSHSKYLLTIFSFFKHRHYLTVILFAILVCMSIVITIVVRFFIAFFQRRSSRMKKQRKILVKPAPKIITRPDVDDDDSPTHNYTSLKCLQPLIAVAGSSSSPSSSSDSTLQNRTMTSTYTYTAIGTHEDFKPGDMDDRQTHFSSNIELIMTTV